MAFSYVATSPRRIKNRSPEDLGHTARESQTRGEDISCTNPSQKSGAPARLIATASLLRRTMHTPVISYMQFLVLQPAVGTRLDDTFLRITVSRLGATICAPHTCIRGVEVDCSGIRSLACMSQIRWTSHATYTTPSGVDQWLYQRGNGVSGHPCRVRAKIVIQWWLKTSWHCADMGEKRSMLSLTCPDTLTAPVTRTARSLVLDKWQTTPKIGDFQLCFTSVDIFSIFTDILIFLRTFTDKSFWVKFLLLRTVRKFTDGWQPGLCLVNKLSWSPNPILCLI